MKKTFAAAIILITLFACGAVFAQAPALDSLGVIAKSIYEGKGADKQTPLYNGHVYIYKDFIVVYVPYLKKWTYIKNSELREAPVASGGTPTVPYEEPKE